MPKNPNDLVNELLEQFNLDAKSDLKPDVVHSMTRELNLDGMTPDDFAAIMSLLLSLLATTINSSYTGFAQAVVRDMLPEMVEEMRKKDLGITDAHVKLVKNLVRGPATQMTAEDVAKPGSEYCLPVQVGVLVENLLAFGLAMHALGKLNGKIKFESGLKTALLKAIQNACESGGVRADQGLIPTKLTQAIDTIVNKTRTEYEEKQTHE